MDTENRKEEKGIGAGHDVQALRLSILPPNLFAEYAFRSGFCFLHYYVYDKKKFVNGKANTTYLT